ncbi:hypothetical protein HCH_05539 [Hahella chejuensis KCTC 2396]|uniref:Uncharacterized protein n=1 Tax=Hahella chejuensis (strain KCTC 2396) TaxID=349521 RepID=Q2SAX4_HAHCH|nr:hypothetical protein [Hahella chejuensis]ABC32200.1 hypothetical protein HCH_05539 [Hahella chejuensis KCTC 2396]
MKKLLLHSGAGLLLLPLLAALMLAASAQATTLIYKDFNSLVAEAQGIVVGTVKEVVSQRAEDRQLYTYVRLADVETLAGVYHDNELTLMMSGGYDGRNGLHVEGSPEFSAGERVVLFVEGNGQRMVPLVGWGQGVFRLQNNDRGAAIVTDDVGNEVYGVGEKGEILKANRHAQRAQIASSAHLTNSSSAQAKASAGRSDGGAAMLAPQEAKGAPMSADRFLGMLRQQAQSRAFAQELRSVKVGQALERKGRDAGSGASASSMSDESAASALPRRTQQGARSSMDRD